MTEGSTDPSSSSSSTFDLPTYISRYHPSSETRLQRLLFLGHAFHDLYLSVSASSSSDIIYNNASHNIGSSGVKNELAREYENTARQAFDMAVIQMKETGNWRRYLEEFGAVLPNNTSEGKMDPEFTSSSSSSPMRSRSDSHHHNHPAGVDSSLSSPNSRGGSGSGGGGNQRHAHPHAEHPIQHYQIYDPTFPTNSKLESQSQLETLEARLATAQSHLLKESIRTALLALGKFHKRRGELREAWRRVWRSREYVGAGGGGGGGDGGMVAVCLLLVELEVDLREWSSVKDTIARIKHTASSSSHETTTSHNNNNNNTSDPLYHHKLSATLALAHLSTQNYLEATKLFTSLSPDLTNQFSSVLSAEDIATYGALLGLASLPRDKLHQMLLDNSNFKSRLELVPKLRDALRYYSRAEYGSCLKILNEDLRREWMLDIHLHSHVGVLLEKIRDRCIVQYFTPYSSVSLVVMGKVFGLGVEEMEGVVARLLGNSDDGGSGGGEDGSSGTGGGVGGAELTLGEGARINSFTKTLSIENKRSCEKKARRRARVRAAKMGVQFERNAEAMIMSMACLENGIVISGPTRGSKVSHGTRQRSAAERSIPDHNMGQMENDPYDSSGTSEDEDHGNMMEIEDYGMNIGYQNDF